MQHTPFYSNHLAANGKIVDFSNWALPINYGSQLKEHEIVRTTAGMFDVSHMVITDVTGIQAKEFLRYLISNDVNKLERFGIGKALYSAMLNPEAGILDDLIIYLMPSGYRVVSNAATETKDLAWMNQIASNFKVELLPRRDLAMIAVQGPQAIKNIILAKPHLKDQLLNLKPFSSITQDNYFYARTGYTGEDGLEIILDKAEATSFWNLLLKHNITPCGLGARDSLRLEAGMNLYGQDMNEKTSPLACNMDWVVDLTDNSRDFIGKKAYQTLKSHNCEPIQVGLILKEQGILRSHYLVLNQNNEEIGIITSGGFSPSLNLSIAMAQIKPQYIKKALLVQLRNKKVAVDVVKLPFVRNGKPVYTQLI